ncbi:hypothetical protein C8R44DRAFT_854601 [Mycena epipterygia]|nr:hypothetical protein C8R44DRAFT_854601 [Mycena epipterygia]
MSKHTPQPMDPRSNLHPPVDNPGLDGAETEQESPAPSDGSTGWLMCGGAVDYVCTILSSVDVFGCVKRAHKGAGGTTSKTPETAPGALDDPPPAAVHEVLPTAQDLSESSAPGSVSKELKAKDRSSNSVRVNRGHSPTLTFTGGTGGKGEDAVEIGGKGGTGKGPMIRATR